VNIFETLLDLADIVYPGMDRTHSFADERFREPSRYLLFRDTLKPIAGEEETR
jgi:hypothetical protein